MDRHLKLVVAIAACLAAVASSANPFEGKIAILLTHGSETAQLLYTVGTNVLRIEATGADRPSSIDIVDLKSGALTMVFPHNRSFMRLKSAEAGDTAADPGRIGQPPLANPVTAPPPTAVGAQLEPKTLPLGAPPSPMPPVGLPLGIGPQTLGATAPNIPPMPPVAMMPSMNEKIELKPTGKKEQILGLACEQFEIKQRGETMDVWATDKLLPFQPYVRKQQRHFGPRMIEEQWEELLKVKQLFPLRASLHFDEGAERFRFEVKSIMPQKIDDKDGKLFKPPEGYFEVPPLPL